MIHDPGRFAFRDPLQDAWPAIRDEFTTIRDHMRDWVERDLYDAGWQVYGVFNFPFGEPIPANVKRCPVTAALVREHFPRHGAAGFSRLEPGTRIRPHEGYQGEFLRCHLPLIVPPGDCALRVGTQVHRWVQGEVVVFDDRVAHCAWNHTSGDRVVLMVDFIP